MLAFLISIINLGKENIHNAGPIAGIINQIYHFFVCPYPKGKNNIRIGISIDKKYTQRPFFSPLMFSLILSACLVKNKM